jgi:enterochelin esterase-like enzyme
MPVQRITWRWLAPAMRLILLVVALLGGVAADFSRAWAGEIVRVDFAASALGRDWHYNAYLPTGYADGKQNYPVMYLLHGYGQNADEWVVEGEILALLDNLIAAGDIPPCLVIMPTAGNSWYIDRQEKMETAFIQDLIPDVENRFHTISRRNGRVIGGESMGGYGALRFVLKYPELFQAAALLSPAIYVPEPPEKSGARKSPAFQTNGEFDPAIWTEYNYPDLFPAFLAKNIAVPLYLGCGTKDQFSINIHMAKLYLRWFQNGWSARWRLTVGGHDFVLWRKLAPFALKFIFKTVSRPEPRAMQPVTEVGSSAKVPG